MSQLIQAVRGMSDILPSKTLYWRYLEKKLTDIATSYGYNEIRFPVVEQTALFKRGIGEATDIVAKEMYTFADRNAESLTLRPEGTASCVRAGIEHGLFYNQIQRLWYLGPMFRHERPQKGRYRQFQQFGIEAYGMADVAIEAEIIFLSARIWRELGLQDCVTLHINSLGTSATRGCYKAQLLDYFSQYQQSLDEDSQRQLKTNPLRILDSKNPAIQQLIAAAPLLTDCLDVTEKSNFQQLVNLLQAAGIKCVINPRLVRGLDYYGGMVFEWVTDQLGAQSAVCSGGRYDSLVELLGGKPTPAVGFALGMERVLSLLDNVITLNATLDAYVILVGESATQNGMILAEQWRLACPNLQLLVNCGGGSFKTQFKRADKSGAKFALIVGDDEMATHTVAVKFLREERPQLEIPQQEMVAFFTNLFDKG